MKKNYEKGFFLSETMVVLAIVAIVLVAVFKLFSITYVKFQESEKYNTVNSINALSNVKKYLESFGEIDAEELLGSNAFVEITDNLQYASNFYQSIKAEYNINNIYLIDMSLIKSNLSTFNMQYKNYINSLPDSSDKILLINVKGNEFTSVNISNNLPRLIGDANNEYAVYIEPGEGFVDPGYTNWNGEQPTTTWEPTLDINTEGIYYLKYTFGNYILRRKVQVLEKEKEFNYTESEQIFIAPATGTYQIELWGASGGNAKYTTQYYGGNGAYTSGKTLLSKGEKIYLYIGGQGASVVGTTSFTVTDNGNGYNGGTPAAAWTSNSTGGGGGGATDIRYGGTTLKERIMVAGGGGGAKSHISTPSYSGSGGAGGALVGENAVQGNQTCYASGTGGTQIAGGNSVTCLTDGRSYTGIATFGQGKSPYDIYTSSTYAGGAGGYYGGGAGLHAAAGGGSSYISGYTGCVAVTSGGTPKSGCTTGTTTNSCSIHYTGKVFTDSIMKSGNESMPIHDGNSTMIGNEGNGYAKITFIG